MSASHTCTVQQFPLPEREYRAAPPERWPDPPHRARSSRRAARQRDRRLLLLLLGLALFTGGFLLGRAGAAEDGGAEDASIPVGILRGALSPAGIAQPVVPEEPGADTVSPDGPAGLPEGPIVPEEPTVKTVSPAADPKEWNLLLVNWETPLPESFQVPELTQLKNGHKIDSRVYPALQSMMDGARAEGLQPLICSSFRTWDDQDRLYRNKVQRLLDAGYTQASAEAEAAMWVARPGTSEHQAGLAVDIVDQSYQLLDEGQEKTAVQQWLMAHCAEYGFILRYPTDKSGLTGVGYEPWHYRYVGEEAARAITDGGLCLEEYLAGSDTRT